ncbi:MAG: Asp/Glu racemase [Rhodoferax sp.]|nr:Asp/Glu racemase [Rhodoferax sp.]
MKLLVLNPNRTATMTAMVVAEAQRIAGDAVAVHGVTAADGPAVIATRESFAAGARAALDTLRAHSDGWADAVLLACFGDPGLAALRACSQVPVIGMADAALREAIALGRPYHIVTAGREWDAMLRDTVRLSDGAQDLLDGISILDTTGLAVAQDRQAFVGRLQHTLDKIHDRGAPTCILGGAGFAGMLPWLAYRGALLDGIGAGVRDAMRITRSRM